MHKLYLLVICLLLTSFTGCIEEELDEEEEKSELENAIYAAFEDLENYNRDSFCKIYSYELEEDIIILGNETELKDCINHISANNGTYEVTYTLNDYKEEETDEKVASNSGPVYKVTTDLESCLRLADSTEPWECETNKEIIYFTKVNGQWIDVAWIVNSPLDLGEVPPTVTLFVSLDSLGVYHVNVVTVSRAAPLEEFSFFLKNGSGSTYVGGNGFGEIAMQFQGGEEHGIDMAYRHFGSNDTLANRSLDIYNDDGSIFPVHFADNDLDGNLSYGDEFLAYGEPGPVEGGWKLEIQHDITNYIVASAKLGEAQVQVYGCIHTNAINYNENANKDDGSCVYPVVECELVPYGHCSGEDLGGQNLSEMNLTGIDLSGANLTGANLTDANLRYAYLEGANLSGANLTDANLANASLSDANMSGAWLYTADLSGAWLDTADLTNAYLRFANLTDANLTSTDLFEARLIGALLKRADLTNADLTNADLVYGWLGFANFTGAIVTDVDFTYAYWEETIWTDGVVYDCTGLCDSPS